jgi:ATP-dependent Lhr-like helicase
VLGPDADESASAESIARQWLDRYGVVSREIWRREKPAVAWRPIYAEFKRLEFRGEVRRGYFVQGLSGAQFARPEAIEMLRSAGEPVDAEPIVMTASDPANVWTLPLLPEARDAFVRPRGRGSLLITIEGVVVLMADRRAARVTIRPNTSDEQVTSAAKALLAHLLARAGRDLNVETIDGQPAGGSRYLDAFVAAGFKRSASGLRYYRAI